jgi:hypothetical protein
LRSPYLPPSGLLSLSRSGFYANTTSKTLASGQKQSARGNSLSSGRKTGTDKSRHGEKYSYAGVKGESEVRSGGLSKWLMAGGVVCLIVYLLMNLSGDMGNFDTRISNAALLVGLAALVGGIVLYVAKEGSKK